MFRGFGKKKDYYRFNSEENRRVNKCRNDFIVIVKKGLTKPIEFTELVFDAYISFLISKVIVDGVKGTDEKMWGLAIYWLARCSATLSYYRQNNWIVPRWYDRIFDLELELDQCGYLVEMRGNQWTDFNIPSYDTLRKEEVIKLEISENL